LLSFKKLPISPLAGWILSWIVSAALLADALVMLVWPEAFSAALAHIEYPASHLPYLATLLVAGVGAYHSTRHAVLGCALLTGFLGGAIALHARAQEPFSPPVFICLALGALLWVGLEKRARPD
jgi:hypothetical protein